MTISSLKILGVLTEAGVEVFKFIGVGEGLFKHKTTAKSECKKFWGTCTEFFAMDIAARCIPLSQWYLHF